MSEDKLILPQEPTKKPPTRRDRLEPILGEVSKIIGSGENAQHSIVYKTIAWSFTAGAFFSVATFFYIAYIGKENPVESIKGVWSIFAPIITLSLGYIFGKTSK
ncbi:MAG: hypothetical protein EOO15_18545 [Chitinophagaceae bacterium]|nr:MAG: hypothetical protein EOO15_18545 [Chitinophagaceae bacterium]